MRPNETVFQYLVAIRELANRGQGFLDETSIMEYCINGIPDSPSNKLILYGCTIIQEFKEKLGIYDKIFQNKSKNHSYDTSRSPNFSSQRRDVKSTLHKHRNDRYPKFNAPKPNSKFENKNFRDRNHVTCFNCSGSGHISKFCPDKHRGPKCILCENFGHKSDACPQKNIPSSNNVDEITPLTTMCKEVKILSKKILSLVDTGSQVTLMKESVWNQLGSPSLINSGNILTGFGLSKTHVIGSFNSTVSIDNQDFPVKINVVPNHSMNFDIIIGCNLIKQANLTITPNSVMFSKPQIEVSDASPQPFVFAITDDIPKFDIGPEIPKHTRNDVEALLVRYRPNKIKTTDIELSITVTDDKPIYHSPRRLPFTERDIVDKQIDEWIQNGVIEPCSSAYASQVLVVSKKDGSSRVCIDFRKLNRVLVKDHYPLPLIENILDKLQDTRVFSTIDLRNGFFHLPVNKQSRPYTSFVTQNGQFQFLKMPFGLSTCPSTFQRFINTVFRDLVVQGILLPYMDDIVILAKNESEAIERLKKVLQVSSDYGLEINFHKCQFLHRKIEFLGHIIKNNKLFPSPSKTKSVVNYPEPKTTKEIQRFLGLTGYFRKFIPAYSVISKPLSDLLRKDTIFNFDVKQKASFDELKRLLCQKPVLAVIDSFTKICLVIPHKTTSTSEVIKKLDIQKTTFGNPRFLITDRGTTFTSDEIRTYCSEQKITLNHITTGLPRANGQVERINRTIIPVLSKMSEDDPTKWFKHVPSLQEVLNSTFQRSINTTPFELLFGTQINNKTDLRIQQLIDEQLQLEFNENRELLRKAAKTQILKVQNENKKSYNLRRKSPYLYSVKDLVAIKKNAARTWTKTLQ
ncbi:retrovirus-related Pol polyprotein from transposon 297 [Trichonephila clavipes]|nr:retrovirus-related Pol polyprotein from transposon 297 [Trichonephila clavipes]